MTVLCLSIFSLLILVIVRLHLTAPGRRVDVLEFSHWIHSFLKIKKDGGSMTVSHVGSSVFIRFHRKSEVKDGCLLLVDVPRARWSESLESVLWSLADLREFNATEPHEDTSVLMRVELPIHNVCDESSGAAGARLAQELFDVLGVSGDAKFRVAMTGANSTRVWRPITQTWREGDSAALRFIGKRIDDEGGHDAHEQEKK